MHRRLLQTVALTFATTTAFAHSSDEEAGATAREGTDQEIHALEIPMAEQEVTVRAPRVRAKTASTTVVTAREIAAVPKRTAEDVLRLVPGLTLVQHGSEGKGYQFFLRGFDAIHGSDLEITLDGIPLNEWSNVHGQGYLDLGFVMPETIQSVDVTKGPFTLEQGAFAMAGSAEYHLGIPEANRGTRISYTAGTTNRHRASFTHSPTEGDGKQLLAAEALTDQGFGQNRALKRGSVMAHAPVLRSQHFGTLSLLGSGYLADFELPGSMREDEVRAKRRGFYDSYDHAGHGRSGKALFALLHAIDGDAAHLRSTLYVGRRRLELLENYTGYLLDAENGDRRLQLQNTWSVGGNTSYRAHLSADLDLHAGLGIRSDHLNQTQTHVSSERQSLEIDRSLQGWQSLFHGFAGLDYHPTSALRLAAGARVDVAYANADDGVDDTHLTSDALTSVSPRVTAEWSFTPLGQVFAAYGRGFRPPEARAFTSHEAVRTGVGENLYTGGNPAMTVADSAELGLRVQLNRYLGGSVSGFGTWIEREMVFDHVSGLNLELNSTRRLGGELQLHSNPIDWLLLMADVSAVDARFVASGSPIPLAPWLSAGARAVVTHPGGFRAGVRFFGLAPRDLPHGATGSPLAFLDLTAGYDFGTFEFDVEVENVLDAQLREGEYHYASDWRTAERSQLPTVHYVAGPPFNVRASVSAQW